MPDTQDREAGTARADSDDELVRQVLHGGRPGERAALELLLRRTPPCWEDAVALVAPDGDLPSRGLDALIEAWRTYRRLQRRSAWT